MQISGNSNGVITKLCRKTKVITAFSQQSWLAKYSMFDAKRKVILKKGYLVEMECSEQSTQNN